MTPESHSRSSDNSTPPKHGATTRKISNPLLAFLAGRWWAGVGVLIALVAVAWAMWGPAKPPPNPLEHELAYLHELNRDDPRSYLTVQPNSVYRTTGPIEAYRAVVLDDGAVLQVRASSWSLAALSIQIGVGARVEASGEPGDNGRSGDAGDSGPRCGNGSNGHAGISGAGGSSGHHIVLKTLELRLPTDGIHVDTSGGAGGNGGAGGAGGRGGRGSRSDACGGGNGGQGGNGGNAGPGGDAGDFSLQYVNAYSVDGEPTSIGHGRVIAAITHNRIGGPPGTPGEGGAGGSGGAGRGASALVFDSQPAGSSGSAGTDGEPAQNGTDGATSIDIIN